MATPPDSLPDDARALKKRARSVTDENIKDSAAFGKSPGLRGLDGEAEGNRTSDLRSGVTPRFTAPQLPVLQGLLSKARRRILP
jgi:hypothetical protein